MLKEAIDIKVNLTTSSNLPKVDWDNLPFGKVFSDHMLTMDFTDGKWSEPIISPFANLSLHPSVSVMHYGQTVFEGMKANRRNNGDVVLFRPDMNAQRFVESCERMCMPTIPVEVFVECVRKLVEVDKNWIPNKEGFSLYIRPFMFAMDEGVGVKPSDTYKFMIFTCPVGAYYSKPVDVKIEEKYTRAAAGGVGRAKTAGNYAASMYPAKIIQDQGFNQAIWTDAITHEYIEESGVMNVVFQINDTLVTPSEDSDTILRGITKRSVVELAKHMGIKVEERRVKVQEVVDAYRNGSLKDAFGAGTAATIAHIQRIGFRDEIFTLPSIESRELSLEIKKRLDDMKSGVGEDPFGWCMNV